MVLADYLIERARPKPIGQRPDRPGLGRFNDGFWTK